MTAVADFFRGAPDFFGLTARAPSCEGEQVRIVLLLVAAAGCQSYQPGSFSHAADPDTTPRATVGCLDVAVDPHHDAAAVGPIARIAIANRCDRAVEVDLGAIRATVRAPGGGRVAHVIYDPRGEIRPVLLDGRSVGVEILEFRPRDGGLIETAGLCLDVSAINRRGVSRPAVLCVAATVAEVSR